MINSMEIVEKIIVYGFVFMLSVCTIIVLYSQSLFYFNKYRVKLFAENLLLYFLFYTALTVFFYSLTKFLLWC